MLLFVCVCVKVNDLQRVWLSWRWEGCVVAAWSCSTGNASKCCELTGTRCTAAGRGILTVEQERQRGKRTSPADALAVFYRLYLWIFCLWVVSSSLSVNTTWFISSLAVEAVERLRSGRLNKIAMTKRKLFSIVFSLHIRKGFGNERLKKIQRWSERWLKKMQICNCFQDPVSVAVFS